MGKADIISHAGDGLYNVQIRYNRDRYTATLADLDAKITALTDESSDAELDVDGQQSLVDAKIVEANLIADTLAELYIDFAAYNDQIVVLTSELITLELQLIELQKNPELNETLIEIKQEEIADKQVEIADTQTNIDDTQALIDENYAAYETAANEANELNVELQVFITTVNGIELQITALEKNKEYLETNMPADLNAQAWCADLTTDLAGSIGTIEVPGERGILQVQPGYEGNAVWDQGRDAQLSPTISLGVAQAIYNFAMFPSWQKWKPTFRHGTISNINNEDDTATVTLDAVSSSQQTLDINRSTVLTDVPVEYMSCNAGAFADDDEVLVMFIDQSFSDPKVIGFKDNPRSCCGFVELFTDKAFDYNWPGRTAEPGAPHEPFDPYSTFDERESFETSWDQFYIDVRGKLGFFWLYDVSARDYGTTQGLWDHADVTIHVGIADVDFSDDVSPTSPYCGVIIYGYFGSGSARTHLKIAKSKVPGTWEDILLVENGMSIDLAGEPYSSLGLEYITGVRIQAQYTDLKVNYLRICANPGAEPFKPLIKN